MTTHPTNQSAASLDEILDYGLWNEAFNTSPLYGTRAYGKRKAKALTEAKAAIIALFEGEIAEVIGEDEMDATPLEPYTEDGMFRNIRDTLRAEQRTRAAKFIEELKG